MKRFSESDSWDDPLYLAGECPPPGTYQEVSSGRTVSIGLEDLLPASLDGHVACYRRIASTWRQIKGGAASDPKPTLPASATIIQSAGDSPNVRVSAGADRGKVSSQS